MKFAIISDIHANLEALSIALKYIDGAGVDKIFCLGDIVGYGAEPNECVELIRSKCDVCLLGNHDAVAINLSGVSHMNQYARIASQWTHNLLSEESRKYLSGLPYIYKYQDITLVHASPDSPDEWKYILSSSDAEIAFESLETSICFIGHSHVPGIFCSKAGENKVLPKEGKTLLNVGSIGQPRDGDPRLSFGLFDSYSFKYENVRLEYPVQIAADKIVKAGLPRVLADRLYSGS